ncbi:Coiled-coil domain-containing protein 9B [Labeo rohita]|uniref:Coiled-coil domain-containing protein 9B n=1 Tax=Labeo rohita TaxID=84645 RepID=A0ABQ8LTU0_LABRO|nr:Coiled-coil domain-containing protein 9B [Labeo rohita]
MSGKRRKRPLECSLSFCSIDDSRWPVLRWIFLCVFVPLREDARRESVICSSFPAFAGIKACFDLGETLFCAELCAEVFIPPACPACALLPTLQPFKETAAVQRAVKVLLRQTHCSLRAGRASQIMQSPTEMMMMKKEHKDAELDKKIEALRKKNEALMKRYQEVEEDKKRAEQEGMSLHSRKGKPDDLTITINKSSNDQRVVTKRSGPAGLRDGEQEKDLGSSVFSCGRGKRRQLLVTTPGNIKGKRVFGERKDRNRPVSPARLKSCAEEEQESNNTRGKQRPPSTKRVTEDNTGKPDQWSLCEDPYVVPVTEAVADLNLVTSKEEQLEYLRWKKEREEIDRERVARHKNAKGQWRRAWDMEKTDLM